MRSRCAAAKVCACILRHGPCEGRAGAVILGKALVADPKHRPHDLGALAQALHHVAPNARLQLHVVEPVGAVVLGGRRVVVREVGSIGAGRHTVDLAEGRRVAPGLYWVRLTQGANRRSTRVAVID